MAAAGERLSAHDPAAAAAALADPAAQQPGSPGCGVLMQLVHARQLLWLNATVVNWEKETGDAYPGNCMCSLAGEGAVSTGQLRSVLSEGRPALELTLLELYATIIQYKPFFLECFCMCIAQAFWTDGTGAASEMLSAAISCSFCNPLSATPVISL